MAPRKTAQTTGAGKAPVSLPLAETSANVAGSSSIARTLKRKTPTESTEAQQDNETKAVSNIHEPASKKQRNNSDTVGANDTQERTSEMVADQILRHLGAIYRRLREFSDKFESLDRHVKSHAEDISELKDLVEAADQTAQNGRDELEAAVGVDTLQDVIGKIDEALESLTERFDEVEDKVDAINTNVREIRIEQTIHLQGLAARLDEIDEKLERPPQHTHYHYPPVWAAPPQAAPQYR